MNSLRTLRRAGSVLQGERVGDYLEFVPSTRDPQVLADLAARINWFLSDRQLPIFMEGATDVVIRPDDAPYMDPELVHDPGWEPRRPRGRPHMVVHDLTGSAALRFLAASKQAFVVSPWFAWESDVGWFGLQRRFGSTTLPEASESAERLFSLASPGGSAFILGTGPSASLVQAASITSDIRITCNSVVRNAELLGDLQPNVIAFTDPVFHCGPSRYAAEFRRDLVRAIDRDDVIAMSGEHWIRPVLAHCPEIRDRICVMRHTDDGSWRWPAPSDFSVRTTSNVLTLLMLPTAFALADHVEISGCDGRQPNERYFWKHDKATQYSDALMEAVFAAHPAFFRDRDYKDYYEQHSSELEALIEVGERAGKSVASVTPSFLPALSARSNLRWAA